MKATIEFFSEEVDFRLAFPVEHRKWISECITSEGASAGEINYIFCNDEYLHQINLDYLNHDTYTDIITFDLSDQEGVISGDIYISVERVKENSDNLSTAFHDELDRVMIHGILHLCGYSDHSTSDKKGMRKKEDTCLSLRRF